MHYIVFTEGKEIIAKDVASELVISLLEYNANYYKTPETLAESVILATASNLSNYVPVTDEQYTLIVLENHNCVIDYLNKYPKTKVIAAMLPADVAHKPASVELLKSHKSKLSAVLTPIPTWFDDGTLSPKLEGMQKIMALADKKVSVVDGVKFIKYLGTIPENLKVDKDGKKDKIVVIVTRNLPDYDWCFVEHLLNSYDITLCAPSHNGTTIDILKYLPDTLAADKRLSTAVYRSIEELAHVYNNCRGIVNLPSMSNRILGCADFSYLLPIYFEKFANMVQENLLVNVRTSVLASTDIGSYENVWAELMTGILDPSITLAQLHKTLRNEIYPGLFVKGESQYTLTNIVTRTDEILE